MTAPRIYHYHHVTKEFVGQGVADPSPLEPNEWLYPANCTVVAPPAKQTGFIRVWDGDSWSQQAIPEPEPEPDLEAELKSWEQFRLSLYSNDEYLDLLEATPLAADLNSLLWQRQLNPLAAKLWQRLKTKGLISPELEQAIATAAAESNLLDELVIVTGTSPDPANPT
ncbi:MAG: hypothetical protein AAF609_05425 [Cyanobacteria bacterium P01_C01_bin.120]